MTFEELYRSALKSAARGQAYQEADSEADARYMEQLLNPQSYAPVWATRDCSACGEGESACCAACLYGAIEKHEDGRVTIDPEKCTGCAACLRACDSGVLTARRDILPALADVKHAKGPVYALIAPSFYGQFSEGVTPGMLRSAFKELGFTEMLEVALFADILTLKETLAFEESMSDGEGFVLTSCCCPIWISLIRRDFHKLVGHIPGSVSPMIAAGRTVKTLHPDALTVFIGPCLAKKAEARAPELKGAVDWVLTYREINDVFTAADIDPEKFEDSEKGHSSKAGRLYGRAGGVSEAVRSAVERLGSERGIQVKSRRADGVDACKEMIEQLRENRGRANYFEGMGCPGGCVGGPEALLDAKLGRENVDSYGEQAEYTTPLDNPYVAQLLDKLGYESAEAFLREDSLFTRDF